MALSKSGTGGLAQGGCKIQIWKDVFYPTLINCFSAPRCSTKEAELTRVYWLMGRKGWELWARCRWPFQTLWLKASSSFWISFWWLDHRTDSLCIDWLIHINLSENWQPQVHGYQRHLNLRAANISATSLLLIGTSHTLIKGRFQPFQCNIGWKRPINGQLGRFHSYLVLCVCSDRSLKTLDVNGQTVVRTIPNLHARFDQSPIICYYGKKTSSFPFQTCLCHRSASKLRMCRHLQSLHHCCLRWRSQTVGPQTQVWYVPCILELTRYRHPKNWSFFRIEMCVQRFDWPGSGSGRVDCGLDLSSCMRFVAVGSGDGSAFIFDIRRTGGYLKRLRCGSAHFPFLDSIAGRQNWNCAALDHVYGPLYYSPWMWFCFQICVFFPSGVKTRPQGHLWRM